MTSRSGGEADKDGNRYEMAWTVNQMLLIVTEQATAITCESIGEVGQGSEFTLEKDGQSQAHQVKRQRGTSNSWSIATLTSAGVLANAVAHVRQGRSFHFVSTIPCVNLQTLTHRARQAQDINIFKSDWLTSEPLRDEFATLTASSAVVGEEAAWGLLQDLWIQWPDEHNLAASNAALAASLLEGAEGSAICDALVSIALSNLGIRLDREKLLAKLAKKEIRRKTTAMRATALEDIDACNKSWNASIERELLDPVILRPEAREIYEATLADKPIVLVSGQAGGGKSGLLSQVAALLDSAETPYLGFRLDRLDKSTTTTELGIQIGLQTSPVAALATAAQEHESLLIIDQLDAVSLASGRMSEFFDTIAELVREAEAFPTMRVLLVCRGFDIENDHRIRSLVSEKYTTRIDIPGLTDEQIDSAVTAMGLTPSTFDTHQRSLLRIPFNLVLLSAISRHHGASEFQSTKQLLDAFWDRKLQLCKQRRSDVRFQDTINTVARAASERQRLSVPLTVLDPGDLQHDAGILESEHILAKSGQNVSFFHEKFFDYAFARSWISEQASLVEFLKSGEQELFRRGQVRQILGHLREIDPARFVREVGELLTDDAIRYHIKQVVLDTLHGLQDPSTDEWEMIANIRSSKPAFGDRLALSLRTTPWFERLLAEDLLTELLGSIEQDDQSLAVEVIASAGVEHGDDVAKLLDPHQGRSDFSKWLFWVVRFIDCSESRLLFDLLLAEVRRGHLPGSEEMLWHSQSKLIERQPAWAVELLSAYLVEQPDALTLTQDGKKIAALERPHGTVQRIVQSIADRAPDKFAQTFVPYLLRVMEATAFEGNQSDMRIRDHQFAFRHSQPQIFDLDDAILYATRSALNQLSSSAPDVARPMLGMLAASPYESAQWLLYESAAGGGEAFGAWIVSLMLEDQTRFLSGYMSNSVWSARLVLQASSPHLSDEVFSRIEQVLIDIRFPLEDRWPSYYGFCLLSALQEERLSAAGRRRLGEMRRRFESDQPTVSPGIVMGSVVSPIPSAAAPHMSDDDWLRAITRHNETDRQHNLDFVGGARELAHVLREAVKADPHRFAKLSLQFSDTVNPAYVSAFLMGIGEAAPLADPEPIFDSVRHLMSFGQTEVDRWVNSALSHYLDDVPIKLFEVLVERAQTSADPPDGRLVVWHQGEDGLTADDLDMSGINTTRGALAGLLGDLVIHDKDGGRTALVLPTLNRLAQDPADTVRTCVAHLIHACVRYAPTEAVAAFKLLVDSDDVLLAVSAVQRLTLAVGSVDTPAALAILPRMLQSDNPEARRTGGSLAAYAAMTWDEPQPLADILASGDSLARTGAAMVCANRIANTVDTRVCVDGLSSFFADANAEVRDAAAHVASALRDKRLRSFKPVLLDLIGSPTFDKALPQLLITLEHAPDKVDDLVLACTERFVAEAGAQVSDMSTRAAGDVHQIGKLIIRGYAQSVDRATRASYLDLLDQLLLLGAFSLVDQLEGFDRS